MSRHNVTNHAKLVNYTCKTCKKLLSANFGRKNFDMHLSNSSDFSTVKVLRYAVMLSQCTESIPKAN